MEVAFSEQFKLLNIVVFDVATYELFRQETADNMVDVWNSFYFFTSKQIFQLLLLLSRVWLQDEESEEIGQGVLLAHWKIEINFFWKILCFGFLDCLPYGLVAFWSLVEFADIVVVDGHEGVIFDFDIDEVVIVKVGLVDLLAYDVQSDVVLSLDHDLHLV